MSPSRAPQLKPYEKAETALDRDREELVLRHLPQIKYIAQRVASRLPPTVQLDDLVSVGVLGLLDAVKRFDESKGVKFKTYAEVRIRGAMLDSLRGLDWAPRSLRRKSRELEEACSRLEQRLGRAPSETEIAREAGLSIQEFHTLMDQLNGLNIGYFEDLDSDRVYEGTEESRLRHVWNPEEDSPFHLCLKSEVKEVLAQSIRELPERERLVVSLYYHEELTMKEIGRILGVNESRISQLHSRAMLRMRTKLRKRLGSDGR